MTPDKKLAQIVLEQLQDASVFVMSRGNVNCFGVRFGYALALEQKCFQVYLSRASGRLILKRCKLAPNTLSQGGKK